VIDFEEAVSYSTTYRVGLYYCSDVLAQVPVREGINLLPLEYVYVRTKWQMERDATEAALAQNAQKLGHSGLVPPASGVGGQSGASDRFRRSDSLPHMLASDAPSTGSGKNVHRSAVLRSWKSRGLPFRNMMGS